jgi:hypothetical protein
MLMEHSPRCRPRVSSTSPSRCIASQRQHPRLLPLLTSRPPRLGRTLGEVSTRRLTTRIVLPPRLLHRQRPHSDHITSRASHHHNPAVDVPVNITATAQQIDPRLDDLRDPLRPGVVIR